MTNGWHWQDDGLWPARVPADIRARAEGWCADHAAQYAALRQLAAQQPFVEKDSTLARSLEVAARLKATGATRLVVVGTGGASLAGQAFCALADDPSRVRFLENCDPARLQHFLSFEPEETAWLIISKSGETVETLATAAALIGQYGSVVLQERVCVITAAPQGTLARLAQQQGWEVVAHPAALGGRFSAFSVVGMVPAAFAGLPVEAMLARAERCLHLLFAGEDPSLLAHAAWFAANLRARPMQVLMAYADRLRPATQWYKQLWAESLGKDGKGGTPVTAIGAIDQHSQLQLYLDGPSDKLVTLWLPQVGGQGQPLPSIPVEGLSYLGGQRMGDVMQATAEATVDTLLANGIPLRVVRGELAPDTLAGWMARQIAETLLTAQLIGVDPYAQPAVEEGKERARRALKGQA